MKNNVIRFGDYKRTKEETKEKVQRMEEEARTMNEIADFIDNLVWENEHFVGKVLDSDKANLFYRLQDEVEDMKAAYGGLVKRVEYTVPNRNNKLATILLDLNDIFMLEADLLHRFASLLNQADFVTVTCLDDRKTFRLSFNLKVWKE